MYFNVAKQRKVQSSYGNLFELYKPHDVRLLLLIIKLSSALSQRKIPWYCTYTSSHAKQQIRSNYFNLLFVFFYGHVKD